MVNHCAVAAVGSVVYVCFHSILVDCVYTEKRGIMPSACASCSGRLPDNS